MTRNSSKSKPTRRTVKKSGAEKIVRAARARVTSPTKPVVSGKRGPRLTEDQRAVLLMLLASGQQESAVRDVFASLRWGRPASSTISYYRKEFAEAIAQAKAKRIDDALNTGLALKAERVAALKEHAELVGAIRFHPDKNGRMWNMREWRQTLEDIALEQGDRKPKEQQGELVVKVYQGVDANRV